MTKTITSISIDIDLRDKFRERFGYRNLSAWIEELIRKELDEKLTITEIENKLSANYNESKYYEDMLSDKLSSEKQVVESEAAKKLEIAKQIEAKKSRRLEETRKLLKGVPEVEKLIERYKNIDEKNIDEMNIPIRFLVDLSKELEENKGIKTSARDIRDLIIASGSK